MQRRKKMGWLMPLLTGVVGFFAGVMMSDTVKEKTANVPFLGDMLNKSKTKAE